MSGLLLFLGGLVLVGTAVSIAGVLLIEHVDRVYLDPHSQRATRRTS